MLNDINIRIATAEENNNEHKAIAIDYPTCRIEREKNKILKNIERYLLVGQYQVVM